MNDSCNHTLHLTNYLGNRHGSWQYFTDERGEYVACGRCGKWYGRVVVDPRKVIPKEAKP